jgi:DNA polymerase-3 subunit alpha
LLITSLYWLKKKAKFEIHFSKSATRSITTMYLIFDTETTGLPKRWDAPITDSDNWPRCIQIAWQLHDDMGKLIEHQDYLVKPMVYTL